MKQEGRLPVRSIPIFPAGNNMKKGRVLSVIEGFTFIEMVIVIAIIGIALPTLYAIFFLILQQQIKTSRLVEVKRQGGFVINTVESLIQRNAVSIHSGTPPTDSNRVCVPPSPSSYPSGSGTLYFRDKLNNYFYFDTPGSPSLIASESSITNASANITSSKVIVNTFSSRCSISNQGYSSPVIIYSFDLCYKVGGVCATGADSATLHFESTVLLPPQ